MTAPVPQQAGSSLRLRLGSLRCAITTTDERYARMLAHAYATSLRPGGAEDDATPDLGIDIREDHAPGRAPIGDRLVVRRVADRSFVESEALTCEVPANGSSREVSVAVHTPELRPDLLTFHFSVAFNRVLLLLDRVILHAAALAYRGEVSLFVGAKGAGKSTLAVALARAGAEVLGEDRILARRAAGHTLVSGCSDRIRVTAKTEQHFLPEALRSDAVDVASGIPKKEFAATRLFTARPHEERRVDRCFFPHVGTRVLVRPVSRREALLRLIDATGPMLRFHDRADYGEFLSRLADVLDDLPAYDLELSPRLVDLERFVECLEAPQR